MHRAELLEEIAGRYGVAAEYPWRRYPQYAVFRHAGNRKWFAVLMNPPGRKLGLATEDEVAILNVKIRAEENSLLRGMDGVLPADLPALVATLTHHIADLSATQDNLADSLAAYPPITPPNLCVGWVHQMNDRRFTLAMLPTIMHEHPDRISAELNFDAFLELSHSDRETLLANEDSARLLREQLRHNDYRDPWRDDTHEDWGERYGLLACQHYLKSKTRVPDDNYERLAASLPLPATLDEETDIVRSRVESYQNTMKLPAEKPALEEIRRIVTIFRELRAGLTADKKTKLKSPSGTLSTAEAISVVNNGMALSGYFGDGALKADDLIAGILGAVVKDPVQDKIVWQEYLDTVVKQRDGWQDLYRAARDMA